jgi:uncharacterized membrane protein
MRFEDTCEIEAAVETVWALTADVEAWPTMTPTITSLSRLDDGPLVPGSRARLVQPGQRPRVWTVTRVEPMACFEWGATSFGIFMTGTHLLEATPGGCRNTLLLDLSGPGAGLLGRLLGARIRRSLAAENLGFKQRAEATRAG